MFHTVKHVELHVEQINVGVTTFFKTPSQQSLLKSISAYPLVHVYEFACSFNEYSCGNNLPLWLIQGQSLQVGSMFFRSPHT